MCTWESGGLHLEKMNPLFAFPVDIRLMTYTTNVIESLNMTLRKVTTNSRIFPSDEVVYKVIYLAMRNIAKKWTMPICDWKRGLNRFAVEFAQRFPNDPKLHTKGLTDSLVKLLLSARGS